MNNGQQIEIICYACNKKEFGNKISIKFEEENNFVYLCDNCLKLLSNNGQTNYIFKNRQEFELIMKMLKNK